MSMSREPAGKVKTVKYCLAMLMFMVRLLGMVLGFGLIYWLLNAVSRWMR